MSLLNNPVTAIKFEAGRYETNTKGQFIDFPAVELKTALLSVSQAKVIVHTQIQGRDGSVKEYVGRDNYSVQITGTLTAASNATPTDDLLNLKKMLDAPVAIAVTCEYLNRLGIQLLVVESYDLPQDAGGISYQTFTINCISEIPTQLRISGV